MLQKSEIRLKIGFVEMGHMHKAAGMGGILINLSTGSPVR